MIRWNLTNTAAGAVEVGGLGFTLPADANSGGLTLEQIAYINSFLDPAISGDRGWVRERPKRERGRERAGGPPGSTVEGTGKETVRGTVGDGE